MKTKQRDEWAQMQLIDDMHTLLSNDCRRAGDHLRAEWHIDTRNRMRRRAEEAVSIFCGRPVTGYASGGHA